MRSLDEKREERGLRPYRKKKNKEITSFVQKEVFMCVVSRRRAKKLRLKSVKVKGLNVYMSASAPFMDKILA